MAVKKTVRPTGKRSTPTIKKRATLIVDNESLSREAIEKYKQYLTAERNYSEKTIESYIGDIKAFIEFLGDKGVEFNGTLQRFYVVSYKNFLVESNYEVSTINKKINSIHALNRYLVANGDMISFLPDFVTKEYIDSGELCYLDIKDMNMEIWKQLIYHKNKWMSKTLRTLINYIIENDFSH